MTSMSPMSDPNPSLPTAPPGHGAPPAVSPPGMSPPAVSPPAGARKSGVGLIVGLVVVGVLAVCGIGGVAAVFAFGSAADRVEEVAKSLSELQPGDCVRPGDVPDEYFGVSCSNVTNIAKVTKVFPGSEQQAQDCPLDTDLLLVDEGRVACAKSTTSERLGRPGKGGGVIVAGDCVGTEGAAATAEYIEVPCTDPNIYEKVNARVAAPAACPAPAQRFAELQAAAPNVVCLADGPGSAGVGDCLGDIASSVQTLDAVPCANPGAGAKVLARKRTKAACEAVPGMTHWIEDSAGLPTTRFLCVKELGT